jgi:hypothetical protein
VEWTTGALVSCVVSSSLVLTFLLSSQYRQAPLRELYRSAPNATRCSLHQDVVAWSDPSPVKHILCGAIRARDGCELNIGPGAAHREDFITGNLDKLSKSAVKVTCNPNVLQRFKVVAWDAHTGPNDDPFPKKVFVLVGRGLDNDSATVGPMHEWERGRLVPATIVLVSGVPFLNCRLSVRSRCRRL